MTGDVFALQPEMMDPPYRKTAPSQNATSTRQSSPLGPSERETPLRTAQVFCQFFKLYSLACIKFYPTCFWCQSCDMKQ